MSRAARRAEVERAARAGSWAAAAGLLARARACGEHVDAPLAKRFVEVLPLYRAAVGIGTFRAKDRREGRRVCQDVSGELDDGTAEGNLAVIVLQESCGAKPVQRHRARARRRIAHTAR